ncbi:MAG TPA: oxidoreductase [Phycisphaerales bacterium]|nr:oxidoreductase [Phycisphaerales bacterium]
MQGTVQFIVGGSGAIGSALARRLAERGATLVIAGRDRGRLEEAAGPSGAEVRVLDATDFDAMDHAVREVSERHGRLDGATNLAGSILLKPASSTSFEEYARTVAQNLTSAFALVRSATRAMSAPDQTGGGSVVLLASAAARTGLANHDAIAAAKAGVIGLTLAAAATGAPRGVRVNCVAPGLVRTPMAARLTANEASLKASSAMHPLGRIGEPDEVARAIEWLLDPASVWVTGQVIGVDGGLGTLRPR